MEHCEILDVERLEDKTLVKTLTANADKFYLLPNSSHVNLCDVIDKLSKNSSDKSALTRVRIAYDLDFILPTELRRGNSEQGESVQTFSELLDKFAYDENLILQNAEDYHVVIDDEDEKALANAVARAKEEAKVEAEKEAKIKSESMTEVDIEAYIKAAEEEAVKDIPAKAVAKLFQQTVFLNLNLDIKLKSEIAKSLIKDRFRANYTRLCDEINAQQEYLSQALEHADLTENGKKRVGNMIGSFEAMIAGLQKARKRPIRIAAMGTKKAGKSVVINSLLKRDYAPTSSELPTPNVIKYIPADKNADLTLEYKGKTLAFNSAKELSDYIGNEFEIAQSHTGEGSGLEDMIIHYPSDDLNGYEVWDTPGPNFAGAGEEHHRIADECIKEADVCIFVMNYSNHLTDDEEKFLEKIHKTFKEENKFYSLFITVNRIDERYAAEVEKSVNRILDYIRLRLEQLDYKNIVIFGTSALQSFYLDKVLKLLAKDEVVIDDDNTLDDVIHKAKKKHRDFMTPLRFVEDSIKNLEDFHEIEEPSVNTLENFSGVPQLWHHVRYVGEQKVDTEIVDHVVSGCEMEFDKLNNALLVTELVDLSEEDSVRLKDLQNKLVGLKDTVDLAMRGVVAYTDGRRSVDFRATKGDVGEQIDDVKREAIKATVDRNKVISKRANLTDYDVEEMQQGRTTGNVKNLLEQIDQIMIGANDGSERKFLRTIEIEGENLCKRIEKTVADAQEKIIRKTDEVKESVNSDSVAGNMIQSFAVPQFPVSLSKLSSKARWLNLGIADELQDIAQDATRIDQETRTRTVTKKRKKRGFWEYVTFWKDRYEDVEEEYSENVVKADAAKFRKQISRVLEDHIKEELEESHVVMRKDVMDKLGKVYDDAGKQCEIISNTYKNIFDTFAEDVNNALDETSAHKRAIEHDIVVLKDIKQKVQPFFDLWRGILSGKANG